MTITVGSIVNKHNSRKTRHYNEVVPLKPHIPSETSAKDQTISEPQVPTIKKVTITNNKIIPCVFNNQGVRWIIVLRWTVLPGTPFYYRVAFHAQPGCSSCKSIPSMTYLTATTGVNPGACDYTGPRSIDTTTDHYPLNIAPTNDCTVNISGT
jgi:hypothetical protein